MTSDESIEANKEDVPSEKSSRQYGAADDALIAFHI